MEINDLIQHCGEWLKATGPRSNIVLSSRIRLARNLTSAPFPNRAKRDELELVLGNVESAVSRIPYFKDSSFFRLADLESIDLQLLVERHLMSHNLMEHPEARGVFVSKEEILSVMVNEEDHLRIQVLQSGFQLDNAWQVINKIDDELSRELPYAFLPTLGYLTACPTNTGTAVRGSVMLHLPALAMTQQLDKIMMALAKLKFVSRGFFGEGTGAIGDFYQISNQVSLGPSEDQIIQSINGLVDQIIRQEEHAREVLLEQSRISLEDTICRAWGTLKNARVISSHETLELVSLVRLGIDLGIIENLEYRYLNEVFLMIQIAHLQKTVGRHLNPEERDIVRAKLIREKFRELP